MANNINLVNVFLKTKQNAPIQCAKGTHVGMSVPDPTAKSVHNGSPTSVTVAISLIGLLLDRLLITGDMAVAKIGSHLYVEFPDKAAVIQNGNIRSTKSMYPEEVGMVIFASVLESNVNKELCELFNKSVDAFNAKGQIAQSVLGKMSDSFYWHEIKRGTIAYTAVADLQDAELNALTRSDVVKSVPMFQHCNMQQPKTVTITAVRKKKDKPPKPELHEIIQKCLDGRYLVNYQWAEEQSSYRQALETLNDFVPNQTFVNLLEKIRLRTSRVLDRMNGLDIDVDANRIQAIGHDYVNVTLSGKPGTGKTRLAYALAAATGMPIYTISCSHNTDEDEFQGLTKMVDGHPTAVPTDTVKCFENGGILLLEEINLPQAAVVMGALGQAVEFPFILKKDGYIPLRRHPLCIFISTMNTGTAGSKVLSQPFANRFKQSYVLDDPTKQEFVRILHNATGAERDVCQWVYDCYERIVACVEDENAVADVESILLSLSMRSCIGAIENIQEGMEPREAVFDSIIGKISEQDRAVAESCKKVVSNMRDPDFD